MLFPSKVTTHQQKELIATSDFSPSTDYTQLKIRIKGYFNKLKNSKHIARKNIYIMTIH